MTITVSGDATTPNIESLDTMRVYDQDGTVIAECLNCKLKLNPFTGSFDQDDAPYGWPVASVREGDASYFRMTSGASDFSIEGSVGLFGTDLLVDNTKFFPGKIFNVMFFSLKLS